MKQNLLWLIIWTTYVASALTSMMWEYLTDTKVRIALYYAVAYIVLFLARKFSKI